MSMHSTMLYLKVSRLFCSFVDLETFTSNINLLARYTNIFLKHSFYKVLRISKMPNVSNEGKIL